MKSSSRTFSCPSRKEMPISTWWHWELKQSNSQFWGQATCLLGQIHTNRIYSIQHTRNSLGLMVPRYLLVTEGAESPPTMRMEVKCLQINSSSNFPRLSAATKWCSPSLPSESRAEAAAIISISQLATSLEAEWALLKETLMMSLGNQSFWDQAPVLQMNSMVAQRQQLFIIGTISQWTTCALVRFPQEEQMATLQSDCLWSRPSNTGLHAREKTSWWWPRRQKGANSRTPRWKRQHCEHSKSRSIVTSPGHLSRTSLTSLMCPRISSKYTGTMWSTTTTIWEGYQNMIWIGALWTSKSSKRRRLEIALRMLRSRSNNGREA